MSLLMDALNKAAQDKKKEPKDSGSSDQRNESVKSKEELDLSTVDDVDLDEYLASGKKDSAKPGTDTVVESALESEVDSPAKSATSGLDFELSLLDADEPLEKPRESQRQDVDHGSPLLELEDITREAAQEQTHSTPDVSGGAISEAIKNDVLAELEVDLASDRARHIETASAGVEETANEAPQSTATSGDPVVEQNVTKSAADTRAVVDSAAPAPRVEEAKTAATAPKLATPPAPAEARQTPPAKEQTQAQPAKVFDAAPAPPAAKTEAASSPVKAARVLAAGGKGGASPKRKKVLIGVALLVLLLFGAGAGYVYYMQSQLLQPIAKLPPPRVPLDPALIEGEIAEVPDETTIAQESMSEDTLDGRVEPGDEQLEVELPTEPSRTSEAPVTTTKPAVAAALAPEGDDETRLVHAAPAPDVGATSSRVVEPSDVEAPKPVSTPVVTRTVTEDPLEVVLQEAYQSYQNGQFEQARERYANVLRRDNANRDALLGLAALAMRERNFAMARDFYTRILKNDAGDTVASAALVSLMSEVDPLAAESELKFQLSREPDAHYLHFALGNVLAAQKKWADAETAFFNAYRLDSDNADYAFNLAVSLDRLGEGASALQYYEAALTRRRESNVGFDVQQVQARVESLRRRISGTSP